MAQRNKRVIGFVAWRGKRKIEKCPESSLGNPRHERLLGRSAVRWLGLRTGDWGESARKPQSALMREERAEGACRSAKANIRQRPSALVVSPRRTGLASARRMTGAEWKRMPITKPLARC